MTNEEAAAGTENVDEEFAVWKKNSPFLYDLVISHSLEWPSLTVQWIPILAPQSDPDDSSLNIHKLVLGTHTSDDSPNFLMTADVRIPKEGGSCATIPKVEIVKKMNVDGEVNRARCMPQSPNLIAAKTSGVDVYIFDSAKHTCVEEEEICNPDLTLKGHEKEGFGLSWSSFKQGYALSGSHDCKICIWDVSSMPESKVITEPLHVYKGHDGVVGDVSWHSKNENLFGSVGDDMKLMIWDYRSDKPQQSVLAHEKEVNYLSFNPYNEWIVATASSDTTIGIFDMRKLSTPLHCLASHTGEVFQVEWDPNHEAILASSADDRRLMIWDLCRVGDEQLEGEGEDGPPELLFCHGGHKDRISDFSWNKNEPWVLSSVADDNTLQVWQMAEGIYKDDE